MHTHKTDDVLLTDVANHFQMEQLETRVAFDTDPTAETDGGSIWIIIHIAY
jgi:hypothetical protein